MSKRRTIMKSDSVMNKRTRSSQTTASFSKKCSNHGFWSFLAGSKWLVLLVLVAVASIGAKAQLAGTGAISGTVQDPTGAVVVNATVTATNVDTNVQTTRKSTKAGDYNITPLIPGTYMVSVAAAGFEG